MTVSAGARILFAVIGSLSIATLWRASPRTNDWAREVAPPDATALQRLVHHPSFRTAYRVRHQRALLRGFLTAGIFP